MYSEVYEYLSVIYVVPIIESVSVEALSLTILSVDVVLMTDGGQNVDNYTVSSNAVSITHFIYRCSFVCFHLDHYSNQ